jgi:hypothetical protein
LENNFPEVCIWRRLKEEEKRKREGNQNGVVYLCDYRWFGLVNPKQLRYVLTYSGKNINTLRYVKR